MSRVTDDRHSLAFEHASWCEYEVLCTSCRDATSEGGAVPQNPMQLATVIGIELFCFKIGLLLLGEHTPYFLRRLYRGES